MKLLREKFDCRVLRSKNSNAAHKDILEIII